MARQLKPYKVDEIRSPNGYTKAPVMFDRNSKRFFVEAVPGDRDSRVWSDTLDDVKRQGTEALGNAQRYEWTPLIIVGVSQHWKSGPGSHDASLVLTFRRLERSPHPVRDGSFVERPHALDTTDSAEERAQHGDIGSCSDTGKIGPAIDDDDSAMLPYSQEVWDGLVAIQATINDAHAKLKQLLKRKDAGRVLMLGARSNHAAALRGVKLLSSVRDE